MGASPAGGTIMRTFQQQFQICRKLGLAKGKVKKKITADMMPFCPAVAKKMLTSLQKSGVSHLEFLECGKFGGQCSSGHVKCKNMRRELV